FELTLPPRWCHGLDDLPGFERETLTVRLTTDLDLMRDERERAIGYLGRAHPLVRRALDRVRHLALGDGGTSALDARVSAVAGNVPEPTVIFTFLGRVMSRAGRHLERVLAVTVTAAGEPVLYETPGTWMHLADPEHAIATGGVWKQSFEGWWRRAEERA